MKCYNCDSEYDDSFKFCPHCSAPNEKEICTNCGKEYDKSYNFCPHCSHSNTPVPDEIQVCKKCGKDYDMTFEYCPYCFNPNPKRRRLSIRKDIILPVGKAFAIIAAVLLTVFILFKIVSCVNDPLTYRVEGEMEMDVKFYD